MHVLTRFGCWRCMNTVNSTGHMLNTTDHLVNTNFTATSQYLHGLHNLLLGCSTQQQFPLQPRVTTLIKLRPFSSVQHRVNVGRGSEWIANKRIPHGQELLVCTNHGSSSKRTGMSTAPYGGLSERIWYVSSARLPFVALLSLDDMSAACVAVVPLPRAIFTLLSFSNHSIYLKQLIQWLVKKSAVHRSVKRKLSAQSVQHTVVFSSCHLNAVEFHSVQFNYGW